MLNITSKSCGNFHLGDCLFKPTRAFNRPLEHLWISDRTYKHAPVKENQPVTCHTVIEFIATYIRSHDEKSNLTLHSLNDGFGESVHMCWLMRSGNKYRCAYCLYLRIPTYNYMHVSKFIHVVHECILSLLVLHIIKSIHMSVVKKILW